MRHLGAHWQGGEWEEVLLLLIAMLHDQGSPIREVVDYLRMECQTHPFNLAFAARCLGEAGDVQDPVHGQELLAELAEAIAEYATQTRKEEARTFVESALKAFALLAPWVPASASMQEAIDRLNHAGTWRRAWLPGRWDLPAFAQGASGLCFGCTD